jgi:hypothetical protein
LKLPITGAGVLGAGVGFGAGFGVGLGAGFGVGFGVAFEGVVAGFLGWMTLTLAARDLLPPSPTAFSVHVRVPDEGAFAVFVPEAPETVPTP